MSTDQGQRDDQLSDEPNDHRPTNVDKTGSFVPDAVDEASDVDPWRTKLAKPVADSTGDRPKSFGRYKVTGTLGQGGFGVVYRGYDPELRRDVAIKVPRPERVAWVADAEAYLTEARFVARLDHPGIAPVHDVGRTDDGVCYTVSKYIVGGDLATWIARGRPTRDEAAELIAQVAESLHYAHQHGLVHRDIKPGNILLDEAGHPVVVDFGLALTDEAFGRGSMSCGTPAYMSPELARGEGHRVDARSDVYSLGIVFYELLTGRRPYRHDQMPELLDEITIGEVRPPRQLDDTVPKELDRICLKSLAKRAADRYATALDLADDLRHWQSKRKIRRKERSEGAGDRIPDTSAPVTLGPAPDATPVATPMPGSGPALLTPGSEPPPKVVPKGLRAFDAHDADFFLQLLPGPTDRDGLPESIRFWKTQVEELDADVTFAVGLIYGPSGSGKSSLIKAGLLPRLAQHVLLVYLEASSDDTEPRLLKGLRKACSGLPHGDLVEGLASLRRGKGLARGQKVLIVLDQFEQWLHSHRDQQDTELVQALRHCDGGHVQCVVMVRDDFWLAASRFMDVLEIPLLQGQNSALVDLFDVRHVRKVLALFGRALGSLPAEGELPAEAEQFLDQAVAGLAEDEKVVSVRIALFAEMVKSKPWKPATLVEIGGITGVGATFLEETFSASTAPPRHRLHQPAARAVLQALLPDAGADIKGHRRSREELLAASGYERRPAEFSELLRILDSELRLITPADEESGKPHADKVEHDGAISTAPRSYQLTHDYLVPSLRDWLTRKQRETRRGRAELRLAERSAAWNAKPDARFLPSWWEWPSILLFTKRGKWTVPERRVMRAAGKYHGLRFTGLVAVVAIAVFTGLAAYHRAEVRRAETLADSVFTARADGVPYALDNLRQLGALALPRLNKQRADEQADRVQRLHAAYALADLGEAPHDFLLENVVTAPSGECRNIVAALAHVNEAALPEIARKAQEIKDAAAKARYAIVALHLGDPKPAMDALAVRSDPLHRTTFIHAYATWHGDLNTPAKLLRATEDSAFRSGLCAALGTIPPETLEPAERNETANLLTELYAKAPDGGTHAAAGWALRQWKKELPAIAPVSRPPSDRRWFINGQGMTMVEVTLGKFTMGTTGEPIQGNNEKPAHEVTLTKPFYLDDREVTVEQFQRFVDDADYAATEKPQAWQGVDQRNSPTPECPVQQVNWFDAVVYCNWLSVREGRKLCYERTGEKVKLKDYQNNEKRYDVWRRDFAADGYRLPTEAEWEYAARAGSAEAFCYGSDEDLLPQYAWFVVNSKSRTWHGGSKLPNVFGSFDMYGNVWEWCWDWNGSYSADPVSDPTGPVSQPAGSGRVLRGGGFHYGAAFCRSAYRYVAPPMYRNYFSGFRVLCGR